jgi:hypothetical protein
MVVYFFLRDRFAPQTAYVIPGYFTITMVTHLILRIAFSKDPKKFSMNFIGALAFKMLASFAFLTIMYMAFQGISKDFVVVFMSVYLIYTVFEIVYLKPLAKTPKA